jgi:signal transduction histidine kinase
MRRPLRRQILLPMVGIVLLTMGLASALGAWLASRRVDRQVERQLADVAGTLSSSNFPLEANVLRQASGLTGAQFVVSSLAGQPLAASDASLRDLVRPEHSPLADKNKTLVDLAGDGRYLRRVVTLDRRPVGGSEQLLHVFYPEEQWREAYWSAIWPPLATGVAAVVLVSLAALIVARHVTLPIDRLQSQVAWIAHGDFAPIELPARDDEVRDLALAVNRMAEQLADYETKTRQQERLSTLGTLGAGIAHQVRNAATGCRLALDLHKRDCSHGDESDQQLAVAARQLELIESHIQRFLTLGRPTPVKRAEVELTDVVREAISLVEPAACHLGAPIRFESPDEACLVLAERESLGQMAVNLLTNPIQATAKSLAPVGGSAAEAGAAVVVRLERAAGRCRIAFGDPGPGPTAAIQQHLFEPFATDKPGGTGLGLVVARQIAEDHGGSIRWERRDERTWFVVELPLQGALQGAE